MPSDQIPPPVVPGSPRAGYSLWCAACGRTESMDVLNLETYSVRGWPRCCSEVMYCGPATSETKRISPSETS
jgi:hypothetical protein